jgi:hypothetical protein
MWVRKKKGRNWPWRRDASSICVTLPTSAIKGSSGLRLKPCTKFCPTSGWIQWTPNSELLKRRTKEFKRKFWVFLRQSNFSWCVASRKQVKSLIWPVLIWENLSSRSPQSKSSYKAWAPTSKPRDQRSTLTRHQYRAPRAKAIEKVYLTSQKLSFNYNAKKSKQLNELE